VQEGTGPRPYDVSLSYLIELDPHGWLDWLGLPADGPVESIESDVGTVLAEVDKVLLIDGPIPWLAHIELQANRDPHLPSRLWQYHALLHHRRDQIRVETTVVLLRPEADTRDLSGRYEPYGEDAARKAIFEYQVVRLWERPAEELLTGGLGVAPLAPLALVDRTRPPELVVQIDERFRRETDPSTASELRNVLLLLLNLRYDEDEVRAMMVDLADIRDTPLYRVIASEVREESREEGRIVEARRLLVELGSEQLGVPDENTARMLAEIDEIAELERLIRRLFTATSWQELLAPAR
jgi:predicted transposase YdaD